MIIAGRLLLWDGDAYADPSCARVEPGALRIEDGRIAELGRLADLRAAHPDAPVEDHGDHLVCPGFVDAHCHYPQTAIVASWGKRLIDWLNGYTFPEEARFGDRAYANEIASRHLDLVLANGTTTVCTFCTSHPGSVDAIFEAAAERGMRIAAGKTCMDRNAPDDLTDTPQRAYDESKALADRWHGAGRATYAITPRFSPTSTPEQLQALGALWVERSDCLMQTHISEQTDEVAWVRDLYSDARDYLDTYERVGLLGERGLYGHAIWLEPRERARLAEVGASVVHCPTSNTFIGSGVFDLARTRADGIGVGLATDTGGGSSFSMLRTMAAAYEIGQLAGTALHPAQLLWLATEGSAKAMHMADRIGRIAPGMEADLTVLDLHATPAIAQRAARAENTWEEIFPTIMMGDDRAVAAVYVDGTRVGLPTIPAPE